jgi:hypothetical protein
MQVQQQIDWDNLPPEHPVCEVQVEAPTLRLQPRGYGYPHCPPEFEGQEEIVVQWFGNNVSGKLKARNLQFAFPVLSNPDSVQWFGHPEWFRVAYFGPLEHWPNPAAIPMFEQQGIKKGTIVLYVLSAQIGMDDGKGGTVPSSFVTTIALLGDPCVGVISPCEYKNMAVCDEEVAKLATVRKR